MFNCPLEQVERFQPTLTLCTNVHVVRVTLFQLTCLKFRYKNLISWANRRTKAAQEKLDVHWVHPFPSFKRMHREWQRLGKAQKLETTIHNGKVGVRWDLPHFFNYVATQKELMESMDFPMIDGEQLFVIIIRGDGFPCGSRPWVQIAIGFANHMEKARTLQYNWTLDVALTSEHDDEAMRVLFCATLQHIQTIIDSGYIQMNNVYYRARIMLGGDSPWLRLLLGLSPYYAIGSIYSFSTWCSRHERWMNTKVRRTTHLDGKFRALYDKGLDCTTAKGCTSKPMLRVDDRTRFIVMCILHLVIRLGDYLTHFICAFCKRLPPLVRARVQTVLNESKTNISLKGKASPDGEETWRLLANWTIIGKTMKLPPKYISVVQEMANLLTAMQSWRYEAAALSKCKRVARRFQKSICPHKRSPYLLWLRTEATEVLKNIYPWGAGMFSGDIVESLNYILKDHFLCSSGRGGGPGGRVARDKRMLKQAQERIFLAKELPRWERTSAGGE